MRKPCRNISHSGSSNSSGSIISNNVCIIRYGINVAIIIDFIY